MAEQQKTKDMQKALKTFKASYDMYERTKKETVTAMKNALNEDGTKKYTQEQIKERVGLLETAQEDLLSQYEQAGGDRNDILPKSKRGAKKQNTVPIQPQVLPPFPVVDSPQASVNNNIEDIVRQMEDDTLPEKGEYTPQAAFDVISLPSKGEAYRSKRSTVPVAYLTAYDENMIVSPNLYRDGHIIDYLIKEKVLNNEIDTMDLLEGDRDAIVLFLRANGYGNEYPISVIDDRTGMEFETIVDLSKLEYKDFKLKGDANGWFDYELPVTKKRVKFRFPTHRDNVTLKRLEEIEDGKTRKERLADYVEILNTFIDNDKEVDKDTKVRVRKAIAEIEKWSDSIDTTEEVMTHGITNRLNLLIMSVDDITDRQYIANFIRTMPVKDSASLRRYISENEPGIDFNIEVDRPESLGGGSMKVFLQFDQYVFLNIAN